MAQKLHDLIDELIAETSAGRLLRRRFYDETEKVAADLTAEARAALYTMNREKDGPIVEYARGEFGPKQKKDFESWWKRLEGWIFPFDEFPKKELPADCAKHEERLHGARYPNPQPRVYAIDPGCSDVGNRPIPLDIVGQGFVKGRMRIELVDRTGKRLPVSGESSHGTYRCGHISAHVTPTAAGDYTVRVLVDAGEGSGGKKVEVDVPSQLIFKVE